MTPDPQDPNSPLYAFIDTQPLDEPPITPSSSPSHFTTRQFTPTAITATLPIIVTSASHGLSNGQAIRATKFITTPLALATGMEQLNNRLFYINKVTTDTFELFDVNGYGIDGRNYTPYISGGEFTATGTFLTVNPSTFPPAGIPDPF